MRKNAIHVIKPYRWCNLWVFDDGDLLREPFVEGVPEMIDLLLKQYNIKNAEQGFIMMFSATEFPNYQALLRFIRSENGGSWYKWNLENMEGWLCPALFEYFEIAPPELYIKVQEILDNK